MVAAVLFVLTLAAVLVGVPLACRPHLRAWFVRSPLCTLVVLGVPALACLLAILWSLP